MKTKHKKLLIMISVVGISVLLYGSIGVDTDEIPYKKSLGKTLFLSDLAEFKLKTLNKTPETFLAENQPLVLENGSIRYDKAQLKYILASFNILGSGGGGSYYDALTILNGMKQEYVDIIDVENTDDNKIYVVAGGLGQPTALKDNIPATIAAIRKAINYQVSKSSGKELGGILNVESGPVNGILAVLMAAELGVPVVNADGGGRSVPSLTNLAYGYEHYTIDPIVLFSANNTYSLIRNPESAANAELYIADFLKRTKTTIAGLTLWPQTGKQLKASKIPRKSYTYAYEMGIYTSYTMSRGNTYYLEKFLTKNNRFISSTQEELLEYKIDNTNPRFDIVTIKTNSREIKAVNENLLIRKSNEIDTLYNALVTAPNLISFLIQGTDADGQEVYLPYNNGDVEAMTASIGQQIYILNSKAPDRMYDETAGGPGPNYSIPQSFLDVLEDQIGYLGTVKPE
jgi:DUF917 family protein